MATCKNPECGKEFKPKREWQLFCHTKCRNTYHASERKRALDEYRTKENGDERKR